MQRTDHSQHGQHDNRHLLEDSEPRVLEILGDSRSHIDEGVLSLLDLLREQLRDDIVRLVELELELFSESEESESNDTHDNEQTDDLPRELIDPQR